MLGRSWDYEVSGHMRVSYLGLSCCRDQTTGINKCMSTRKLGTGLGTKPKEARVKDTSEPGVTLCKLLLYLPNGSSDS